MATRKEFLVLCSRFSLGGILLSDLPLTSLAFDSKALSQSAKKGLKKIPSAGTFIPVDSFINYQIIRDDGKDHLMIFAFEFDLNPGLLGDNKNVSIFSYKTKVSGEINLPSRNFFLLTNKIEAVNNAKISVSGTNGKDFVGGPPISTDCNKLPGITPAIAQNIGDDKISQDDKRGPTPENRILGQINGGNAGNLFAGFLKMDGKMVMEANGGTGGKGQDGRNGRDGCPANLTSNRGIHYGYSGENGGTGASGGYGGNAGNIITAFKATSSPGQIVSTNNFGLQGESGAAGVGGKKTRGYFDKNYKPDPDETPEQKKAKKEIDGFDGKPGEKRLNDHSRDGLRGTISTTDYNKYIPVDFALLMMLKAESLYLSGQFTSPEEPNLLVDLLTFVYNLASSKSDKGFYSAANTAEINTFLYFQAQDEYNNTKYDSLWSALKIKALSHLSKIRLGLDIFGNPPNYAPNLSLDFLQSKFKPNDSFEPYYKSLTNNQIELQKTQLKSSTTKDQCLADIDELKQNIDTYINAIKRINKEVSDRYKYIELLKDGLGRDDIAFRQEVEVQAGGCKLEVMIDVIVAVVAIVATIYSLGTTSEAALAALGTVAGDIAAVQAVSDIDKIVTDIKDLSQKVATVEENIDKLRKAYNSLPKPDSKIQTTLLNVDKDDFDKMIDQFLALPSAKKYKADYHFFIDYVMTTNQMRLEMTSNILKINAFYQNINILKEQVNEFDAGTVSSNAVSLSNPEKLAIFSLYYKTKWIVAHQVYLQQKALAYQYPAKSLAPVDYNSMSIETLTSPAYTIRDKSLSNLDDAGFHPPTDNSGRPFHITFSDFPQNLKAFGKPLKESRTKNVYYLFEFKIVPPIDDGSGNIQRNPVFLKLADYFDTDMYNIKIMGVQLALNSNVPQNKQIKARLNHSGDSTVTTAKNFQKQKLFSHSNKQADKLTTSLTANNKSRVFGPLTKTNLFGGPLGATTSISAGVSPFATWQLKIYWLDNQTYKPLELENIVKSLTSMDLFFWYYYQT